MPNNDWNTLLYDKKHSYVFKFGEDVLNLLNPKPGEVILDLGCGTGHLTNLIAKSGACVYGIDSSVAMIEQAHINYPGIKFNVMDALNFSLDTKYDAVFSNAVLHWIPEKEKVIECIRNCLKQGGRFVAEFGGKDNVKFIVESIKKILAENGYSQNISYVNWYFPSIGEYSSLLEKYGFRVTSAFHFDRDTFLDEGIDVVSWLEMFAKHIFEGISTGNKNKLAAQIKELLVSTNFINGKWFVDYKRLRIVAVKE
ncbi:MAG: methyltransferase domain-containing protein [Ignavibacteriaceae bacterium]|jgi:trans-aconitate 2-methyltransferase